MNPTFDAFTQTAISLLTTVGLKVLAAAFFWFAGRAVIRFSVRLVNRFLTGHDLDPTVVNYIRSSLGILLTFALAVALLGFFGVETTTFAALLAGAGIAIGAAWSGLLANFASGAFLVIMRPFKVGDLVCVAGVTGVVRNIGIFRTTIDGSDNVQNIVGNGAVLADKMQNYSANPYRRVEFETQLDHTADPARAIELLIATLKRVPNVRRDPAPEVGIASFNLAGPVLAVRPYAASEHYWQVYFDSTLAVHQALRSAGFRVPGERAYEIETPDTAAHP